MVKIHHVLDQNVEHEVALLPKAQTDGMYALWVTLPGDDAPEKVEPTPEQLTAVLEVVNLGAPHTPTSPSSATQTTSPTESPALGE